MTEIKFHENGQGYFRDLVEITSEEFAALVAKELGTEYRIADFMQDKNRFEIFLTDKTQCHIKVLTFCFYINLIEVNHIWKSHQNYINAIFQGGHEL